MLKRSYREFFKTLGNQQRVEIMLLLLKREMSVNDIAKALDAPQSSISHNLKCLEQCSFVSVSQQGKKRIYKVNEDTIAPLFMLIQKHSEKYCKSRCG